MVGLVLPSRLHRNKCQQDGKRGKRKWTEVVVWIINFRIHASAFNTYGRYPLFSEYIFVLADPSLSADSLQTSAFTTSRWRLNGSWREAVSKPGGVVDIFTVYETAFSHTRNSVRPGKIRCLNRQMS